MKQTLRLQDFKAQKRIVILSEAKDPCILLAALEFMKP